MKRFISLFSGGGGADIGAMAAGYTLVAANEYDEQIANVYRANLGDHIRVGDILEQDPHDYPPCDLLHASPPCPNFSVAKTNRAESEHDIELAEKVAEFIRVLSPYAVTIENVQQYRKSESFKRIMAAISDCGYMYDVAVLNAADYGVPQTRRRLFVRACKGLLTPMPEPVRWVGWYEAIEDLIPALPESHFAPWQLKRLPDFCCEYLLSGGNTFVKAKIRTFIMQVQGQGGDGLRFADETMQSVTSTHGAAKTRAFIMSKTADKFGDGMRQECEPAHTIGANEHGSKVFVFAKLDDGTQPMTEDERREFDFEERRAFVIPPTGHGESGGGGFIESNKPFCSLRSIHQGTGRAWIPGNARAWLSCGRVVAMTPRCLARFQSFPDWYQLPDKAGLACKIIGNAVPPKMYEAVIRTFDNG